MLLSSPSEQHTAVGKETGETTHVERWKNTLRQRLARFVIHDYSRLVYFIPDLATALSPRKTPLVGSTYLVYSSM